MPPRVCVSQRRQKTPPPQSVSSLVLSIFSLAWIVRRWRKIFQVPHDHAITHLHPRVLAGREGEMDTEAGMIPSSPSAETSPSSSDIDTESTGSFFRDRSTTLGTLMGVSFADAEEGHQARREVGEERERPRAPVPGEEGWRWRRRWRRRRWRSAGGSWWRLCRDDVAGPTSLGHFLDMERQLSGAGLLCGDGGEEREATAPLFENGRVLPSSSSAAAAALGEERGKWKLRRSAQGLLSLARLPVLLTGICSGSA